MTPEQIDIIRDAIIDSMEIGKFITIIYDEAGSILIYRKKQQWDNILKVVVSGSVIVAKALGPAAFKVSTSRMDLIGMEMGRDLIKRMQLNIADPDMIPKVVELYNEHIRDRQTSPRR